MVFKIYLKIKMNKKLINIFTTNHHLHQDMNKIKIKIK
jgi:hypothetical protein